MRKNVKGICVNRLLSGFVWLFLVLPFIPTINLVGLGFWDSGNSKVIVLKELESIIVEKPIESPKLEKAVADFNALWATRVGCLLEVEQTKFRNEKAIYLRQSNRLKSQKVGSF